MNAHINEDDTLTVSQDVDPNNLTRINPIETVMNQLSDVNNELGDLETFALMLSLPDEALKQIEPLFLDEIENVLSDSNTAIEIASALNIAELSQEDFIEYMDTLFKEIEKQLSQELTPYKIEFLKKFFTIIFNSGELTKTVAQRAIQIPIKVCNADAKIPKYARIGDAGLDVYAIEDCTIQPGETKLIPTGIKVAIPRGYELQVRPKSGQSLRTKLRIANTPGTIDSGYRDEVGIIIENIDPPIKDISYTFDENGKPIIESILHGSSYVITKGEKIAQLVLNTTPVALFMKVDEIEEIGDNRGGGFGSTGLFDEED